MNGARSWLLAASLGSFAAGTSIGLLIPRFFAHGDAPASDQEEYVCKLVADHGLTGSQERSLRLVMQNHREQEINVLLNAEPNLLPPGTQSRLLKLRYQTTQRIRAILDAQQRARYDEASRSGPAILEAKRVLPERGEPSTEKHR